MSSGLSPEHREFLTKQAVNIELAERLGVRSLLSHADNPKDGGPFENWANFPAILFPWTSPDGRIEYQVRADNPTEDAKGKLRKYVFAKDMTPVLWAVKPIDGDTEKVAIVEGTKQCLAAASYAPPGVAVYGIAGCRSWQKDGVPIPDLQVVDGHHHVVVILDADAATNPLVFQAGMDLRAALELEGATKVTFARLGAKGKDGLDDVLGARPTDASRFSWFARVINAATSVKPADKAPKGQAEGDKAPAGVEPVDVSNPADAAVWLQKTIGTGNLSGYFSRDGEIVYAPAEGEDGYIPLSTGEDEHGTKDSDGPAQVRPVNYRQIAARVSFNYWCFQSNERTGRTHAMFPAIAADSVVNVPDLLPNLRRLRGLTHTPLVRRDGSILDTPGYDPGSRLYFMPLDGLEVPKVPEEPTADELAAAVALVSETCWDFPFRSDDHRANFLGLLLTPLMREVTPPPYKLGVFDAPQSRSGKTLMSKVLRTLHGGVIRSSVPSDEAEWSKTLSTILNITTAPIVTFDNVRGELTSATLDALLTEDTFQARQLGVTDKLITRTNDRVWTLTSNNAKLGGDLAKRALWVSINANRSDPEARSGFRHQDLVGWITQNRGELLAALLTMVRAWVVAGRPAPSVPGSDIWWHWTGTVRAILEHAGVPGMFDRPESKRQETSEEDADWATFMGAVRRVFGEEAWTGRQLLEAVDKTAGVMEAVETIHPDELPGKLGEKHMGGQDVAKSLGKLIGYKTEAWVNGYMVSAAGRVGASKIKAYKVLVEDTGTDNPQPRGDGGAPPRRPIAPIAVDFPCDDCSSPVGRPCVDVPAEPTGELDGVCDDRANRWCVGRTAFNGWVPGDESTEGLIFSRS